MLDTVSGLSGSASENSPSPIGWERAGVRVHGEGARVNSLSLSQPKRRVERSEPLDEVQSPPWAAMLGSFYEKLGLSLPPIVCLKPPQMPSPCRQLLVHSDDMTPTLERFYEEPLSLQVQGRDRQGATYLREVVLALADSGTPVEYGVICIHLERFPEPVQTRILSEQHPFGHILETEGIAHLGWPQAFFSIAADARLRRLLHCDEAQLLYGRRNVLLDGRRRLLADVIEILAPVPTGAPPS